MSQVRVRRMFLRAGSYSRLRTNDVGNNQVKFISRILMNDPNQTKQILRNWPGHRTIGHRNIRQKSSLFVGNRYPLIDEVIDIKIHNLDPNEKVTLRAETSTGGKMNTIFQAFAHYQANSFGEVNLSLDAAVAGTYTGVEPMGLFWSMLPVRGQKPGARIFQRDSSVPVLTELTVHKGFTDFDKDIKELDKIKNEVELLHATTLERYYLSKTVTRLPVRDGRLRGSLFIPEGEGPFPGVIDMFGTAGGLAEPRAALLASHGFLTYALPFFAYDDLPQDLEKIEIEYFEEAVDWLLQHPKVKKGGIGMMGSSKGGELALLTAGRKPEVKAVVGVSPPHFISVAPLSISGHLSEYLRTDDKAMRKCYSDKGECFDVCRYDCTAASENATIPVERINGKILLVGGTDDMRLDMNYCTQTVVERLEKCQNDKFCRVLIFPGAGHLIEPPHSPVSRVTYHKMYGMVVGWGGLHARAQERTWQECLRFFNENIQ